MLRTEVRDGGIFWMTLDDPTSLNATDQKTMEQLVAAWQQLRVDPSPKVAVLTGAAADQGERLPRV